MVLRVRMLAVLALLVGLNALFVFAVLWGFGVLLPTVVTAAVLGEPALLSDLFRLPVSVPVYAALVVAFLGGQVYYGYRRVFARPSVTEETQGHEVDEIVRRLAMRVDIPTPSTRIIDSEQPSCYTVGRFTDATIVVTTGLIERLDSNELEAVLAHELAHVVNRDVTLMTVTTLVLEIATRTYHTVRLVPRALRQTEQLTRTERIALRWFLPLSVVVYVVVSPLLLVFPKLTEWATKTLSHAREFAADEAAAATTGAPLALATGLVALDEAAPTPERDLRRARTQALCIVPTPPVTGPTASDPPEPAATDREPLTEWLPGRTGTSPVSGTHPPVEKRVERLQSLAAQEDDR